MKKQIEIIKHKYQNLSLPLRAGVWFTVANFMQRGLTMITTPIFTRILSKEEYGMASTYVAWQNVLTLVVTLSLFKSLMNLYKDYDDRDKSTSAVVWLGVIASSVWSIIGIIFSDYLAAILGMSKTLTVALFISFTPLSIINCWGVQKRYEFAYKESIVQSLVTVVLSTFIGAICVLTISPTAESRTIPTVVVSWIVAIILLYSISKKGHTIYNKTYWEFALSFCIPLLPHYLSEFILQSSDKLMINAMCGKEDVAVYSIAFSVGSLINLLIAAINNTVIPYRYQRLKDKNYEQLAKVSNQVLLFVGAGLVFLMLMAPEIIYIFGGKQYEEAKYLVIPICLGVFFHFVFQLFSTVQEFYESKSTIIIASISCAFANIILNYVFIGIYGYQAAAYTTFVCHALFSCLHYVFYRKVCKEKLNGIQVYDIKGVVVISLAVIVAGIIVAAISSLYVVKYILLIAGVVIAILLARKFVKKGN